MITIPSAAELLAALRDESDHGAWQIFCERYEPMLLACARRADFQESDARDIVQETLLAFVEGFRAGRYDLRRGSLRAWLQGIAYNKMREAHRRRGRREFQVTQTETTGFINRIPDESEFEDVFEKAWERAVVVQTLREVRGRVDEQTFKAFVLFAVKNWEASDVADYLGMSRNAVYIAKSRVLAHFREIRDSVAEQW